MKYRLLWLLLLFANSSTFCAFRSKTTNDPQIQPEQQIVYVSVPVSDRPNPIEEDRKTDQALFVQFVKILGNFSKILIDPHNKPNVTSNVAQMVDGVVSVVHELTKRNNLTEQQLDNLVRLVLRALIQQGFVPPSNLAGFTVS